MAVKDPHDLRDLGTSTSADRRLEPRDHSPRNTYGVVCFAILADRRRSIVDLFNHTRQIFAHLIQPFRELLCEFVARIILVSFGLNLGVRCIRSLPLLIRPLKSFSLTDLPRRQRIHVSLISIQPSTEFFLLTLHCAQLPFYLRSSSFGL